MTSLRVLHEFTDAVSRSVREQDVISTTLDESRSLLRAEVAGLVLASEDEYVRLHSDEAGTSHSLLRRAELPGWLQPAVDGEVVRLARARRDDRSSRSATGHRDLLAVPLRVEGSATGVLLVADRVEGMSTFGTHDEQLLETLAGSAAVALANGRLVERLLEEAAEKEHRALHDALTGLPNRQALVRRVGDAHRGDGPPVAVLHVTLGGIPEVREDISNEAGDALLVAASEVLARSLPAPCLLARATGDDLAVVLPAPDAAVAVADAEQVVRCSDLPVPAAGLHVLLTATVGIASATDGADGDALLLRAHAAGLAARGGCTCAPAPGRQRRRRTTPARSRDRPVGGPGRRRGRGRPPARGVLPHGQHRRRRGARAVAAPPARPVPPTEFVPVAESAGLVWRLTQHVLDRALAQCATWRAAGAPLTVAVNLSMRSLHEAALCDHVRHLLDRHGLGPSSLVLEITEGSMMTRPESTLAVLDALRRLGVGLAIDDFGTGYSSLAYLAQVPVTELKIDESFVFGVASSEHNAAIVRSTVALAHDLGLDVVAEGVEDLPTWKFLADRGCDLGQGYLMSRPLPPDALADWLAQRPRIPAQAGPAGIEHRTGAAPGSSPSGLGGVRSTA